MHAQETSIYADSAYHRLQKLYFLAAQSENYLQSFETLLGELIRQYGPLPNLQMYRYGGLALKARYVSNLIDKKNYLFTAIASMDAQVSRTPDDIEIRFIRGSFYYYLPFFLGKGATAREDIRTIAYLLESQVSMLKSRYTSESLRAIIAFLAQTGWVDKRTVEALRQQYNSG